MRIFPNRKIRNALGAVVMGLIIGNLVGCLSSSSDGNSSSPSDRLTGTMLTSTEESGMTATVGMPRGDISKPAGNPITLSSVPSNAQQAPKGYTRVAHDDPSVSYSGNWVQDGMSSGSPAMESTQAGAQARYSFTGTAVQWVGNRDMRSGIADVYLDGMRVAIIDTYSSVPKPNVVLYSATGLSNASHLLAIQVESKRNPAAQDAAISVGDFDAELTASTSTAASSPVTDNTSPSYIRIQQNDPSVSYSGSWDMESSSLTANFSGGSAAEATSSGAQATLTFTGTAVRWIGYRDTLSGIGDVFLDGAHVATVDTYSLLPASQVVMYSATGLSAGSHTLMIKSEGRHNLLSLGSVVWVDAFDVLPLASDTTPPTVSMTAPANGTTVSGTVSVSANASDNVGVAGVQFELDGSALGSEVTSAPYSLSWDSTTVPNGSHSLTAVARDAAGNRTTATSVTVTVSNSGGGDTTPPTVTMTAPANGATVSATVTVSADASDNVGVAGVQFQLDGANLGSEVTSAPYSISWDTTTASNGTHSLTAVARDAAGNRGTAAAVTVTVSNGGGGGDTTPPTVSMTAPANGATVSGMVPVSADASDNVGVVGVQFELDGAALGAEVTSAPYSVSWDSSAVPNGSHSLTAVARDAAGNHTTATPVTVTVSNGGGGDTTPPTVSMTAPANGATVTGTATVSANASDNVGVAGVQFQLDGGALGAEVTSAPYSITWNSTTVPDGSHSLTAVARDAAGNHTTATPVTVTVSNGGSGGTTTRIEQDNPAVAYNGNWITASDSSVSGGTATETNEANATATLTFTGTGVTWISYTSPNTAGIASVSVDGGTPTQVDTYTAATVPQAKVFSVSNLPKGSHTLKITVSGNFDQAGNSAYVVVDAFDVTN